MNGSAIYINIFPDDPFDTRNPVISNQSFIKTINEFDFCLWSKKIIKKQKKRFKTKFICLPFGFDSLSIPKLDKVSKKKEKEK